MELPSSYHYVEKKFPLPEAVVRRCFVKKVFLKILENSQENTCAPGLQMYQKETLTQVFSCEFRENFKNIFFTKQPW